MSSPAAQCSFEDTVIDFAGHRLLRGGVEQPLEPKAFGVLALLAGEPGRVFLRDEILDVVWGHRHITPGVLNRVMTLLRQALGEDAHHPRLLQTVHGVGYRFDLPPPASMQEPMPAMESAPALASGKPVLAPIVISDAPMSSTRRLRPAWFLLLAVVGLGAAGAWWWTRETPQPPTTSTAPTVSTQSVTPTLVVMPLKPIGSGDSVKVIADGLGEELIGSMAQIKGLRVIARDSTRRAAAESDDPARVEQRLGITHALEGSLQQAGQSLRVRLRLIDAQEGRALWTRDFDRDASEVLLLQREIAEAVAASLTLQLGLTDTPSRSGDAEFLHRYLGARAVVNRRDLSPETSTEHAEREFRELIRQRPDDARAHSGLALALEIRAQRRPSLAITLREEAKREATLAQRLDATLPEPYAVLANSACNKSEWEHCMQLMAEALRVDPSNSDIVYSNARVLARLGYLDRAETILRELAARDPLNRTSDFLLGRLLDTQGRHEEARRVFDPPLVDGAYARWFNAVWRKDYAEALRIAETEIAAPDHPDNHAVRLAPSYIKTSRALVDPSLWPLAFVEFERFEQSTGLTNFNRVLAPDAPEHAAELIRELNGVRQRGYSSWDLLLWTKDLAFLRRDPAFQDFLRENGILAYWRKHGFPPQCRAQGEGAYCE